MGQKCSNPLFFLIFARLKTNETYEKDMDPRPALRPGGGRRILYRFGMIYGGGSFVAFDPASRRFLVILRNVTSWPAAEDFDLSSRFFEG